MKRKLSWDKIFEIIDYISLVSFFKHKGQINPIVVIQFLEQSGMFIRDKDEAINAYRIDPMDSVEILNLLDKCVKDGCINKLKDGNYTI